MPSARAAFFMETEFMYADGRTKLSWPEYKKAAEKIKKASKGELWSNKVRSIYGQAYWPLNKDGTPDRKGPAVDNPKDGVAFHIKSAGGDKVGRTQLEGSRKKTQKKAADKRTGLLKIQPETEQLIEGAKVSGKTVEGFKDQLKIDNKNAANERKVLSILTGKPTDKGHGLSVRMGGSDRITNTSPEIAFDNQSVGRKSGRNIKDLDQANIGAKQINAAANYLIDGEPELDVGTRTKIHQGKEDINKILAEVNTPKVKETKRQLKHVFKGLADAAGTSNNPLANVGGDLVGVFFDGVAYAQNPNMQTGLDLLMSGSEAVTSLGAMGLTAVPIPGARVAAYALMKAGDNISKANQILQIGREGITKLRGKSPAKAVKIRK